MRAISQRFLAGLRISSKERPVASGWKERSRANALGIKGKNRNASALSGLPSLVVPRLLVGARQRRFAQQMIRNLLADHD